MAGLSLVARGYTLTIQVGGVMSSRQSDVDLSYSLSPVMLLGICSAMCSI